MKEAKKLLNTTFIENTATFTCPICGSLSFFDVEDGILIPKCRQGHVINMNSIADIDIKKIKKYEETNNSHLYYKLKTSGLL